MRKEVKNIDGKDSKGGGVSDDEESRKSGIGKGQSDFQKWVKFLLLAKHIEPTIGSEYSKNSPVLREAEGSDLEKASTSQDRWNLDGHSKEVEGQSKCKEPEKDSLWCPECKIGFQNRIMKELHQKGKQHKIGVKKQKLPGLICNTRSKLRKAVSHSNKSEAMKGKVRDAFVRAEILESGMITSSSGVKSAEMQKEGLLKLSSGTNGLKTEVKSVEMHHEAFHGCPPRGSVGVNVKNVSGKDIKHFPLASSSKGDSAKEASSSRRTDEDPDSVLDFPKSPNDEAETSTKSGRGSCKESEKKNPCLKNDDAGMGEMVTPKSNPMVYETSSVDPLIEGFPERVLDQTGVTESAVEEDPTAERVTDESDKKGFK
ncbi:OLC1v1016109C1 [Oldenlandia corymbosa var. corymbosa]|uniref:OLC1v1016109C1 n=1 Tax=Oldenlandia corymbosa var. corymbosa TaxID=529605 RepID=A0AAV1E515_OLDCO|nr:OLC1v1016109C1 [Oldenlandia corymbosa var. corymbosa]